MHEGSRRAAAAAASGVLPVPDELTVEILARLPAKTLCLCKCVSRAWRAFISDPANRSRFAQTLSGVFFSRPDGSLPTWDFIGLSVSSVAPLPPGVDTALSFLPPTCGEMELLDSCNGLLLLRCEGSRERPSPPPFYVVCNPATGEWVTLPQPSHVPGIDGSSAQRPGCSYRDGSSAQRPGCSCRVNLPIDTSSAALGFDPSISPHFHVFQLVLELDYYEFIVCAVEIYSSQTGRWVLREAPFDGDFDNFLREAPFDADFDNVRYTGQKTYFKGFLHFCMKHNSVRSVDTEGQTWRITQVRENGDGELSSVCHSQGRLLYVYSNLQSSDAVSIYVLEDLDSEEWTWVFKQSINRSDLLGPRMPGRIWPYYTAAFHPDSDLIFFYDWFKKRLVSYDMKHRDVHAICTLEVHFEFLLPAYDVHRKFFPYVPLYSGALPSSSLS